MPEPAVRRETNGGGRSGKRRMSRMRQRLPRDGRAVGIPEGVHRIGQGVHGGGVRGAVARMRIPMQCEHDSLMAQARQDPAGRPEREGPTVVPAFRRPPAGVATRLDLTKSKVQRRIVNGSEDPNRDVNGLEPPHIRQWILPTPWAVGPFRPTGISDTLACGRDPKSRAYRVPIA